MATIYKRGKYWWIAYKDATGARVAISTKQSDKSVAKNLKKIYEVEEKKAALKGTPLEKPLKVSEFFLIFQANKKNRIANSTLKLYKYALNSFLNIAKDKAINKVSTSDIEAWYTNHLETHTTAGANCFLRHLKGYFSLALKLNYIEKNPVSNVSTVKENNPFPRTLSEAEVSMLLESVTVEWQRLIKTAIYTGCRLGELCRLMTKDVDLERRQITVDSTSENPTKARQFRVIPLPLAAIPFFTDLTKDNEGYLLKTPSGTQWQVNWVSRKFIRYARAVSLDCTFHDLRRTCGAWLIMKGADLVTVQKILGHSSVDVTVKHYVHLLSGYIQSQADKMPEL